MEAISEEPDNFGGILSDLQIQNEIKKGNIIIEPFVREQLSNSSYDICLGPYYFEGNPSAKTLIPWSAKSVDEYWGKPLEAQPLEEDEATPMGLPTGTRVIFLEPGEFILACSEEFIGGRGTITTQMKAKSTLGRLGVRVCDDAGQGDVGYINRWTMEIKNSTHAMIPLVVGQPIAQIVFFRTGPVENDYTVKGSYQKDTLLDNLMQKWKPEDMLPRYKLKQYKLSK